MDWLSAVGPLSESDVWRSHCSTWTTDTRFVTLFVMFCIFLFGTFYSRAETVRNFSSVLFFHIEHFCDQLQLLCKHCTSLCKSQLCCHNNATSLAAWDSQPEEEVSHVWTRGGQPQLKLMRFFFFGMSIFRLKEKFKNPHLVQFQLPLYDGRRGSVHSLGVATLAADVLHHLLTQERKR